jgi:hypothetical protein
VCAMAVRKTSGSPLYCGRSCTVYVQIANDITQKTPASFEPSIDYVVTKVGGEQEEVVLSKPIPGRGFICIRLCSSMTQWRRYRSRFHPVVGLPHHAQVPRFAFEKFPGSKAELTTMMKSVGEVMAIGRTWQVGGGMRNAVAIATGRASQSDAMFSVMPQPATPASRCSASVCTAVLSSSTLLYLKLCSSACSLCLLGLLRDSSLGGVDMCSPRHPLT